MKKASCVILLAMLFCLVATEITQAQLTGHYPLGVEGVKAGTLPPPGLYSRNYFYFYNADDYRGSDGKKAPIGFDVSAFVFAPRLIWITEQKILGADFGMDVLLPFTYQDIEIDAMGVSDNMFCAGDLCVEPIDLAWHGPQYDLGAAAALWFPTGKYDADRAASPGKDFWTTMLTFGGTYYFDQEKTISASALGRFEMHSEADELDVKPGNNILVEWGVAKTLGEIVDVGVAGYAQWQLTDDSGRDVWWDKSTHDRIAAIGPEVSVFIPPAKMFLSCRALWEFSAVDRSEGAAVILTLTKPF